MRKWAVMVLLGIMLAEAIVLWAVGSGAMPLGVRGEWEWLRVPFGPSALDVGLALAGVATYSGLVAIGFRAMKARATVGREALALASLAVGAVGVQAVVQTGAPAGYGLAKWVMAVQNPGASGYFTVARTEVHGIRRFLVNYPTWVTRQDALHIGTHPPGLIVAEYGLLAALRERPGMARWVVDHVPQSVEQGFKFFGGPSPLSLAERATVALTGLLTLVACGLTVVPLYSLGRASLPAPSAWSAAALWPVVPASILFQPTADTAFPLLSTSALALAAHAARIGPARGRWLACGAGVVLGVGMQFSLVFLPVGLIVAMVIGAPRERTGVEKLTLIVATGLGFLAFTLPFWAVTGANPFATWWTNQQNHSRFYAEYSRSYRAWVVVNAIELAVALGVPATAWLAVGFLKAKEIPRVALATLAVLMLLTLSGRNLSEVARLWIPFMPALLAGAGSSLWRLGGPLTLGLTALLAGVQALALQAMIQVVYPV